MAGSLHRMKTILPYSRAQMFTAEWRGVYQAHHILEKEMMEKVLRGEADHVPAIILTDVEHKEITRRLNDARKRYMSRVGGKPIENWTPKELWSIYQQAYPDRAAWLAAIEPYFK
jgi:hypothetical protein